MQINSFIFIGMAGVGKSSIGKAVSKAIKLPFIDVDTLISEAYGASLQDIIANVGEKQFQAIESTYVLNSIGSPSVISPGGSFIYLSDAIKKIQNHVLFIYLFDEPMNIKNRISDINTRGILGLKNKTFEELCFARHQLYEDVANVRFNLNHYSFDDVTDQIINFINALGTFSNR